MNNYTGEKSAIDVSRMESCKQLDALMREFLCRVRPGQNLSALETLAYEICKRGTELTGGIVDED